jgi:hypothetical protein
MRAPLIPARPTPVARAIPVPPIRARLIPAARATRARRPATPVHPVVRAIHAHLVVPAALAIRAVPVLQVRPRPRPDVMCRGFRKPRTTRARPAAPAIHARRRVTPVLLHAIPARQTRARLIPVPRTPVQQTPARRPAARAIHVPPTPADPARRTPVLRPVVLVVPVVPAQPPSCPN